MWLGSSAQSAMKKKRKMVTERYIVLSGFPIHHAYAQVEVEGIYVQPSKCLIFMNSHCLSHVYDFQVRLYYDDAGKEPPRASSRSGIGGFQRRCAHRFGASRLHTCLYRTAFWG